jgi:hypothetical protein
MAASSGSNLTPFLPFCDSLATEKLSKARRLQKQADKLRAEMSSAEEDTWRKFTVCD